MRTEPLFALRRALLLAIGACASPPPAEAAEAGDSGTRGGGTAPQDGGSEEGNACDPVNLSPQCVQVGEPYNQCNIDADCHDGAYPRCVQHQGQLGPLCKCDYSCRTDADCKSGQACVCADALGDDRHAMCVAAPCKEDAECESGSCDLSIYVNGCATEIQLACRTAQDTCVSDADCPRDWQCIFDGLDGRWDCLGLTCIIGRPLTVEGGARTAKAVSRVDWLAGLDLRCDVTEDVAAALAAHWTEIAALEHASVASFARFTLELMALGAPPELLAEAQRAARDEIEHARIAWSLVTLWAGRAVGPGPLALAGVPIRARVSDIVHAIVKEGCVGETLGAAEAADLAAASGHPTMVPIFRTIAQDETRHAALAWRTLRWLLTTRGDEVRRAALAALAEARAELDSPVAADDAPSAPAWGLLRRADLVARRREAFAAVVEPVFLDIIRTSPAKAVA